MYLFKIILMSFSIQYAWGMHPIEVENTVQKYLQAYDNKDKNQIEAVCTKEFFIELNDENALDIVLSENKKPEKPEKYILDIKKVNDVYMVAHKLPKDKHFSHHWFKVKKQKDKWLIFETQMLDPASEDPKIKK